MRRLILTFLLTTSFFVLSQTVTAQDRGFGLGAAVSGPDGISYKLWLNESTAISGLVSFSISEYTSHFYKHLDVVGHKFYDDLDWEVGRLHYYYGGGLGYEWRENALDDRLMIRGPAGFGFLFTDVPVDIFFELAPSITVSPDFDLFFSGNMGFRFYLN